MKTTTKKIPNVIIIDVMIIWPLSLVVCVFGIVQRKRKRIQQYSNKQNIPGYSNKKHKQRNEKKEQNPVFFFLETLFFDDLFFDFLVCFPLCVCVWVSVWKRPFIYLKIFSFHSHCLLTCSVRRLQNTKFFFSPIFYCLILTSTDLLWIT